MLRLDTRSLPARAAGRDRGLTMLALVISLGLHGAALACFVLLREVTPPEPYAVIAVELVQDEESTGFAATSESDDASAARDGEPTPVSGHAPAREKITDERETEFPIRTAPARAAETASAPEASAEAMLRVPPAPRRKPLILTSSTGAKSARHQFEKQLADMKDESPQKADPKLTREVARSAANRAAVRTQQIATLDQGKNHAMAASPATVRGGGLANAAPRYPYLARRQGQEGRVIVRVQVSAAGNAATVSVRRSSGYRLLDEAAVKAVKSWRFAPANRGGISVAGSVDVPVSFKLTD